MLAEVTEVDVGTNGYSAGGRFGLTSQAFEEGRLASTVNSDHGNLIAAPDQPGDATENRFFFAIVSRPYFTQIFNFGSRIIILLNWKQI